MEEFDLELEQNRKRPVQIVKKGGWLGKIVALLLGIVIGFVGCFGAIAAVVYYFVGVMKIEEGAGYLKSVLGDDFDYTDYIAEEYGDKTTLDLISSTLTAAQTVMDGTGTLNTLNEIYPMLYTLVAGEENPDPNAMFNGLVPLLQQYGLDVDADTMMKLIINGTGGETLAPDLYLGDYIMDKTYDLAIGDLLQMSGFQASPIIDALFFGEENVDYIVNTDGLKEPLEGGTPWLTLEDLLFSETDVIGERIGSLALASVMSIKTNNNIMMTLAYGNSSRYTVTGSKVTMNQQVYTFDNTCFYDDNGEKVDGTVDELENGVYSLTTDGTTLYLKESDKNDGSYLAYTDEACSKKALYKKTTISDLEDDPNQLINRMELGSTLKLTPSSNKVLLALAYGTEGEDYDVVNGKIKMRDGKKERTFGDLTNGGNKLIEDVRLADVMEADNDDAIMMYLLYGKLGVHYDLVNNVPTPQKKQIAVLEHNSVRTPYNVYGDTKLDGTLKDVTYTFNETTYNFIEYKVNGETYYLDKILNADSTAKTVAIKGTETETQPALQAPLYYVYTVDVEKQTVTPVMFEPTTLGELMNDKTIISNLTGRLTLKEVMGADTLSGTPMEKLGEYIIDEVPDKIETLQIRDVIKNTENNSILKHLQDSQINELAEDVEQLKIGQILENDIYEKDTDGNITTTVKDGANPVLVHLRNTSITGLTTAVNDMTVGDIFGDELYEKDTDGKITTTPKADANPILLSLSGTKIINLDERMNTLTLGEVFKDEIFNEDGTPKPDANPILLSLSGEKIIELDVKMNDLTVGQVFEDEIYEIDTTTGEFKLDSNGKRIIKGTWYYLLKDPATGDPNVNYKLTSDMDTMMENMSANIENASLKELNEKGIIDLSDNDLLSDSKTIPYEAFLIPNDQRYKDQNGNEKTLFNQLTVSELFDFVGKIIPTTPKKP